MTATATRTHTEWGRPDPLAGARARTAQAERDAALLAAAEEREAIQEAKRAERIADVSARLPGAIEEYEVLRGQYIEAIENAARVTMAANAARTTYADLWSKARNLGLPVPTRIAPVALGDAIRTIQAYGPGGV